MTNSWLSGELLAFDLETTGVDRFNDVPVSFALVRFDDGEVIEQVHRLVNPGRPIPPGAQAVHGISDERAVAEGMAMVDAVELITAALLDASTREVPLVGFNLNYDLTMMDARLRSIDGRGLEERGWNGPVVDPLVLDRHFEKYRKGKKTLDLVCEEYGASNAAAHDAAGDAEASARVLLALSSRHSAVEAASLAQLMRDQVEWHRTWAVSLNQFFLDKGREPMDERDFDWPIAGQVLSLD